MNVRVQELMVKVALLWSCACGDGSSEPLWRELSDLESKGWLVSTTASPSGDVWLAVGGSPAQGALLRESADATWLPESIPPVPLLNWAQVFADGTRFAVGNAGTILHFDGSRWSLQTAPTQEDLWGVWGARPDDVWAVGGAGQREGQATLLHYDGTAWQAVALPTLERPNVWALYKVWGARADDVYVVGQRGVVLHFDGTSFRELGLGTGEDLIAVYGVASDRLSIVGGRSSGFIATFDGTRWNSRELAPLPGLNGVWMGDRATIHVAGVAGTLAELDFDTLEPVPAYQATNDTFHALHGAGRRVLAVGGNLGASRPPYQGLARERTRSTP